MRTIIDLSEQNIKTLDRISKSQGISRAEIIRRAVSEYLKKFFLLLIKTLLEFGKTEKLILDHTKLAYEMNGKSERPDGYQYFGRLSQWRSKSETRAFTL